jgi:hypothetical protein
VPRAAADFLFLEKTSIRLAAGLERTKAFLNTVRWVLSSLTRLGLIAPKLREWLRSDASLAP